MFIWIRIRIQVGKNLKKRKLHQFFFNLIFQNDFKKSLKISKQNKNLSISVLKDPNFYSSSSVFT